MPTSTQARVAHHRHIGGQTSRSYGNRGVTNQSCPAKARLEEGMKKEPRSLSGALLARRLKLGKGAVTVARPTLTLTRPTTHLAAADTPTARSERR
jgi:hypothetical protein